MDKAEASATSGSRKRGPIESRPGYTVVAAVYFPNLFMMVCTLSLILIPYSKVVPYGIPLADERTTKEAEFRQLAVGMTKPKATEIESPPHNCPANPMAS